MVENGKAMCTTINFRGYLELLSAICKKMLISHDIVIMKHDVMLTNYMENTCFFS